MLKILTIGAFERDNFGDYLFFLLYARMLGHCEVAASGMMFADRRTELGHVVLPYAFALQRHRWDAVIVVGGEVGAVSPEMAIRMCLSPEDESRFRQLRSQGEACRFLTLLDESEPAYIPDLNHYPLNAETPLLFNSVGISRLEELGRAHPLVVKTMDRIRRSQVISVRDTQSVDFLLQAGVTASLRPDIVHAIRRHYSSEIDTHRAGISGRYVVVQASAQLIDSIGTEAIAREMLRVAAATQAAIVFFAAGTANYHDDFARYEKIRDRMQALQGAQAVSVEYQRDPLYLVAVIANAVLWIGSSLHGRIIAIEYGVPRISLENAKVRQYVALWDADYPFDVRIEDLAHHARMAASDSGDMASAAGSELGRAVDADFLATINPLIH